MALHCPKLLKHVVGSSKNHHLIIAASSGIGQANTKLLLSKGHTVLETTNFDAVDKIFSQAGVLDGIVNCSGSLLLKSVHPTSR